MKRKLNILLLVFTLLALISLCVYLVYNHFREPLDSVDLTINRNSENGFVVYEDTYQLIMDVCDTVNNTQINMIDVDSVVNVLNSNPWTTGVEASISLKSVLEVDIVECEPIARVYNSKDKSVYIDNNGNIFPTDNDYVPRVLVCNGNINFPVNKLGNVKDEIYLSTDLPEFFALLKEVLSDDYSRSCVKQIYKDKKKNYIFSLNNTNIIVIFGDVNNIKEKLHKMKHFFERMQGNPELDNYKEINLNYKNQVVCTKNK